MTVQDLETISKKVREAIGLQEKITAAETLIDVLQSYLNADRRPKSLLNNIRDFIYNKSENEIEYFKPNAAVAFLDELDIEEKETALVKQLLEEAEKKRAEYEIEFRNYKI